MSTSLIENLINLGLSENEATTYLTLSRAGWITALNLSKKVKINRSTLYRVLDSLEEKGLVQTQIDDTTTRYKTTSIDQLKTIVKKHKEKTKLAEESFNLIKSSVDILKRKSASHTKVNVVRGINGLQHLEYVKTGKKDKILYAMDSLQWYEVMGKEFAEEIRQLCVENNITVYELSSDKSNVTIEEEIEWTKNKKYLKKHYKHRVVEESVLDMTDDIYIIDDTIHFYEFDQNEIIGIEIVNSDLSKMLSGIFKILWNQAKVVDSFGGEDFN